MKKTFMQIIPSLFLFMGLVVTINAVNLRFEANQSAGSRAWRLLEQTTQIDSEGTWDSYSMAHNHFNPSYPTWIDSTVFSYFDDTVGWIPGNCDHFSYDASGQYVTEIISCLTLFTQSIPMLRGTYTYDTSNRLTNAAIQISGLDRDWFDVKRMYVMYDANGFLNQIISWDIGDEYLPPHYTKQNFTLDSQGRISSEMEYASEDSINWMQAFNSNYTYNMNDNTTGASLVNMISRKLPLSLFYDKPMEIGMLNEKVRQIWMYQFWRNDSKDSYTYSDDVGTRNMTYHVQYIWTMVGEWQNSFHTSFSYDTNGNLSSSLQQIWNEDISAWQNYMLTDNLWGQTTANEDNSVPTPNALALIVYPNPFKDNFAFEIQSKSIAPVKVEIFNCKGQKVHQETVKPNTKSAFNSQSLSNKQIGSGVYFLKAQQGSSRISTKIVKLH